MPARSHSPASAPPQCDAEPEEYTRRSMQLKVDPKMAEMQHYIGSHEHEARLRDCAELETRVSRPGSPAAPVQLAASLPSPLAAIRANTPSSGRLSMAPTGPLSKSPKRERQSTHVGLATALRTEGINVVDSVVRRLAVEASGPSLPSCSGSLSPKAMAAESSEDGTPTLGQEYASQKMETFNARLQWRNQMDNNLRRLLLEPDLDTNGLLRTRSATHKLRCEHLDKTHAWYVSQGKKEVRKERQAPPYLRFDPSSPVMPGSLRPNGSSPLLRGGV